ncbi:substrate-binding domain-containing protein [Cellulomonas sp. KRMCY2]|uniref:substrate-binding domain-containing protein n=1 Tax=Cellulomonas sp. KRMCY2 TaxID=1304865 RepID=UPI00045E91B4|nr:substrate-binding domain-containing protein [Cellulomonas sp. KRMCY2]
MKRSKVSALLTTALIGALAVSLAGPAAADPTPQPKDIVGVGSDTSQFALNYLADGVVAGSFNAGYNAGASARLVSFDALKADGPATIVLKAGTAAITRPNGSGSGKALLYGATNNVNVNYARSSSGPSPAENSANLWHVPFAVDGLKLATATTSNAPASITPAQMVDIYKGTVTNWNQIGGGNGVIVPMIPQAGSGTRTFFEAQLKAANGNVTVVLGASVVVTQEHDAAPVAADPNAVSPFSTGRFATATGIKLVNGAGSFTAQRALYNVVRAADLTKPWFTEIFGENGFVCSGGAGTLIAASGFTQLATGLDGGVCGVPTQAATTNFTTL